MLCSIEHPDEVYWQETNAGIWRTFGALYRSEQRWLHSIRRGDAARARRWQRTTARWQRRYQEAHEQSHMKGANPPEFLGYCALEFRAMRHPEIVYTRWRSTLLKGR